ncbi:MAG: hypothetical protein ACYTF5_21410 [Planctomycetota bacterium]|jgi:hypothetical protein
MRTPLLVCTALAVAAGLAAQAGRVVPSASATKDPNYYDYYATYGTTSTTTKNDGRGQYIYDSGDVGGAAVWTSIAWRRPHYISNTNKLTTFNMTIIMSNSPVKYNAPSATFKANHGTSTAGTPPKTVLNNAKISLPANSRGTSWPEPWFTPIPISVFVYVPMKGGSLVIECIGSNNSQNATYYCEGHKPDTGQRISNGPSGGCQYHSDGKPHWNSSISYRFPVIGGTWYVDHGNMPSNVPNMKRSLNIIGLQGIGGTAFGKKLPIPITTLGFLDVCKTRAGVLANDLVITQPMTYTPNTTALGRGRLRSPTVNIPNDPKLGGVTFYQQPICADKPIGNYDQIYMGWPSKWIVGTGTGPLGSVVYRVGDNTQTSGFVRNGYGRTMLLK